MSDCGVCLSSDFADDCSGEFFDVRVITARKHHNCSECFRPIVPGQRYEYAAGKWDGEFHGIKTCLICAEIAEAFYCDGRLYGGSQLWENMSYIWRELTTSCFDKLKTPEAKAYLREWWMKKKGLTT
jgi:hypothetical protein